MSFAEQRDDQLAFLFKSSYDAEERQGTRRVPTLTFADTCCLQQTNKIQQALLFPEKVLPLCGIQLHHELGAMVST